MSDSERKFILHKEFLVTSACVDFEGKVKVSALTNFLIQAAWQHAEQLGWGVDDLRKQNLAWVLSSLKIKILSYPEWKSKIKIDTWPKGVDRLFYLRDFKVSDDKGKVFALGTSNWILIDIEKRRPKVHQPDDEAIQRNKEVHAIKEKIEALSFDAQIDSTNDYVVRYSDIDINHHLTTTRYVDLMFDSYSPEFIRNNRPKEITLNFIKEVKFGQKVTMTRGKLQGKHVKFQLLTEEQEKPCFKANLVF